MNFKNKPGDNGVTTNLNGEKISKNAPLIHLIGALDELNSHLGLIKVKIDEKSASVGSGDKLFIEKIQQNLVKLMSHVSDSLNEIYFFSETDIIELENEIIKLKETLPGLRDFTIPGKNETEAFIHIARTVARRAECWFVSINENTPVNPHCRSARQAGAAYLNRLSFYLFVLSLKYV